MGEPDASPEGRGRTLKVAEKEFPGSEGKSGFLGTRGCSFLRKKEPAQAGLSFLRKESKRELSFSYGLDLTVIQTQPETDNLGGIAIALERRRICIRICSGSGQKMQRGRLSLL